MIAPAPLISGELKAQPGDELIRFHDLWKSFGQKKIYEGLELDVRRGETLTVIGGSGTGKSVLLKCLIGLLTPDRGSITFDGDDLVGLSEDQFIPVRTNISMLFQGGALFDSIDVGENVAYPLREHFPKMGAGEIRDRVAHKLELVGLPGIERMRVADLSGGMRKRVGLARAIAIDPEVVLYDEPTTGLDPMNTRRINELILKLNDALHVTGICVTHDMASAYMVSHRMAMLYRGRILFEGTVDEVKASDIKEVRAFIDAMSVGGR